MYLALGLVVFGGAVTVVGLVLVAIRVAGEVEAGTVPSSPVSWGSE